MTDIPEKYLKDPVLATGWYESEIKSHRTKIRRLQRRIKRLRELQQPHLERVKEIYGGKMSSNDTGQAVDNSLKNSRSELSKTLSDDVFDLQLVESKRVYQRGYNLEHGIVRVVFKSGAKYDYGILTPVPLRLYSEFQAAESPGQFVEVLNGYGYLKIT